MINDGTFGPYLGKRKALELLRSQLEVERSSFMSHWRELGEFILPRGVRFSVSDVNKGDRRDQMINDITASLAARTLQSGMVSGASSPARPWFRLTTPDPRLAEWGPVKEWLHKVTTDMRTVYLKSNFYQSAPIVYKGLGVFGTSAMGMEEDVESVFHSRPFPIGSYMLACDHHGKVNTFFREFKMTVEQVVRKFSSEDERQYKQINWRRFSNQIKTLWDNKQYQTWIDVCHAVTPNENYDPYAMGSQYKKFSSCYYERGFYGGSNAYDADEELTLRESGYGFFPVLCPRWEIGAEDVYGIDCPGMTALGDVKQLQKTEDLAGQAITKMVKPPMKGPTALKTARASILPGEITFIDEREGQKGFVPVHEVDPRIQELEMKQGQVRQRIKRAFFEDLFLMLITDPRQQPPTAREVAERKEEKLIALGPVMERLNQDFFDPLTDLTFNWMWEQGKIPPPPPELQGMQLKVEYISIMAQAQKEIGLSGLERLTGYVLNLATQDPAVMDKLDRDESVDKYAEMSGVDPGVVVDDEVVAQIRAQRAKVQQAQAAAALAKDVGRATKDLADADMSKDSALKRAMEGEV